MKKIFISIVAIAAIAACSKTEEVYDTPAEIGFAPVKGNLTKAEGLSGNLATTQNLGVWAFWDKDGNIEDEGVSDYNLYKDDTYLENALFVNKGGTSWGGSGNGYPWPVNGSLVFAGYTTPGDDVLATNKVSYDLVNDKMTFTEYANTDTEFDLCWFGRTANSYNNRVEGGAVTVPMAHALTWVSIAVYGEGTPVNNWSITSMKYNNLISVGTATCVAETATWSKVTSVDGKDVALSTDVTLPYTIQEGVTENGKTTGAKLSDNVLIPSTSVTLTVNYTFKVNGVDKTDTKVVKLNEDATWESGKHYTYTLVFKANEILVSPSYDRWDAVDQSVTVE